MDDDLWGPPLVVQDDTLRNQTLRGCEFWFDCRTDVLEENFQNEKYCEQAWRIMNGKKPNAQTKELDKDSVSLHNDMASPRRSSDSHDVASSDSDKTLSAILPNGDTSCAKSALDDDENTSSISDAQTIETRDSANRIEDIDPETRLKPQEIAANDPLTLEVAEDADTSSGHVLASKNEEAEEHSSSSLVTDQVLDPIKQAPEKKSSSAISRENIEGSTLKPLPLESREKVGEKANATNEDGEILKDHQQSKSFVTLSEPFTTESLLAMCDEPDKGRETIPCDERSKRSLPEAKKTVVKEELIVDLFTEARQKAEKNMLLNARSVLIKKRQSQSTSFIRNTKQKVKGEAGENNVAPVKNTTKSTPEIIMGSSHQILDVSLIPTSELKLKTRQELRLVAKELKITLYYKLKKEDLLQRILSRLDRS